MAQGQRAGLITPRSLDRNGSPVYIIHSHWCFKTLARSGSETLNSHPHPHSHPILITNTQQTKKSSIISLKKNVSSNAAAQHHHHQGL